MVPAVRYFLGTNEVELRHAWTALESLVKLDVQSVCDQLFKFLEAPEGEEHDALRETAIKLLQEKVPDVDEHGTQAVTKQIGAREGIRLERKCCSPGSMDLGRWTCTNGLRVPCTEEKLSGAATCIHTHLIFG